MRRLLMVITVLLVISAPAFALSDAEYLRMKKNPEFAAADRELTEAYNEAKKVLDKSEFAAFRQDQREWIANSVMSVQKLSWRTDIRGLKRTPKPRLRGQQESAQGFM